MLNTVSPIDDPWIAIMDHSIDIGVKKVLVVLRVKVSALTERGSAISLEDCECIGLKVHDFANGEIVASDLKDIFLKSGTPNAIIKDGGSDLKKGFELWEKERRQLKSNTKNDIEIAHDVEVIDDIGHVFANALKAQFSKSIMFENFLSIVNHCSKKLRQTKLAFLIPPKIRTKGRYQGILNLANWALKILDFMDETKNNEKFKKLHDSLKGLVFVKPIVLIFSNSVIITSKILKILKNEGLNEETFKKTFEIAESISDKSPIKKKIIAWLNKHYEIYKRLKKSSEEPEQLSLIVSSDIIESLFGKFKNIQDRSSMKDMNRSVLLIPALCGLQSSQGFHKILLETKHSDIESWDKENIPYTQNRLRRKFLAKKADISGPKTGNLQAKSA